VVSSARSAAIFFLIDPRCFSANVLAAMCAATVLTATAALWPAMEPAIFHAVGVAKKPNLPAG